MFKLFLHERRLPAKMSAFRNGGAELVVFAVLLVIVCFLPYPDLAPAQGLHGYLSSHGLTLAAHLSPEHHFLMYNRIVVDSTGAEHYEAYNRFSIVPFALIRGAMAFGGDDLFAQIAAARKLMLLFWLGAMFCAYLALKRLGHNPLAALAVVLLAFSSRYFLQYNDMIFNDLPALFGCMLLFHGLVVHWLENRPRQLMVKALIAVALGWQAYAMLLPAVALLWWKNRRTKENLTLAGAPLLLGVALLAFNLANECIATKAPLLETSTAQSIAYRIGVANDEAYEITEPDYSFGLWTKYALHRISLAATPALATMLLQALNDGLFLPMGFYVVVAGTWSQALGALILLFAFAAVLAKATPRFPAFCLLALALGWTVSMRHFTFFHDFQMVFSVGIPLILFGALLRRMPDRSKILPLLAIATAVSFLFAAINVCESKVNVQMDAHERLSALRNIAETLQAEHSPIVHVDAKVVEKIGGAGQTLGFALSRARFTDDERVAQWRLLDSPVRIERLNP